MMALLDHNVRGVPPEKSLGARSWDNYAWHTDLPRTDCPIAGSNRAQEFHDFMNSDMIVISGLNLVENKMADPIRWQSAIVGGNEYCVLYCALISRFVRHPTVCYVLYYNILNDEF